MRVFFLDFFKYLTVIGNIPIRKETALDAHFSGIDINSSFYFFKYLGDREDIPVRIPECAESACSDAPVREIDIPVNYISNLLSRCLFPELVGQGEQERRALVKDQCIIRRAFTCFNTAADIIMNAF